MSDKESRTEDPTDKKKADARKEGNIARSQDLVSWGVFFIGLTIMQSTVVNSGRFLTDLINQMEALISHPDQAKAVGFLSSSMTGMLKVIAPLAVLFMVLGIVGHFAQVKFVLAWKAIKPDFKKLDPIKGTKRIFSKHAYVEAGKQLVKMFVLGYVAYDTLWITLVSFGQNGPYSIGVLMEVTAAAVMTFLKQVAIVGVVIGLADYFYQRKKTTGQLKMTKEEVKQEGKNQEGSPEMKGRIRQKQRSMSRNRMMASIKEADVVIVNPVHVAVALKYDAAKGAPRVVAKGAGFVAEKIREKADEHKVPLIQDIPLARTLHRSCEVDEEIPMELFTAVAQVLAFVFALRNRGNGYGFHKMPGTPELDEYEREEARKVAAGTPVLVGT